MRTSSTKKKSRGRMSQTKRPERVLCENPACRHMSYYHRGGDGICTFDGCYCGHYQTDTPDEMAIACANCPHIKGRHYRGGKPYCIPANGECECPGFATRVERFPSYSRSVQSEPQPQYEEHQASDHSRCKDQHVRTVGVLLARMGSTLELDPQGEPEKAKAQLYRLWPALYSCGEVECQAFRTLVEQGLSNRLLELVNSLRTHTEPPETSSR